MFEMFRLALCFGIAVMAGPAMGQGRFDSLRTQGQAQTAQGAYLDAGWSLRRAANLAQTPAQIAALRADFATLRARNPFSYSFGLSVAPSDNINDGASESEFTLGRFRFLLPPEALALSGIQAQGHATLTARLSQSRDQITSAQLYVFGRRYRLSAAAKASAPRARAADYAMTVAEASLIQRRRLFADLGPSEAKLTLGQHWYGGKPALRYGRLRLAQDIALGATQGLTLSATVERQTPLSASLPRATIWSAEARYGLALPRGDHLTLTLSTRRHAAALRDFSYWDHHLGASYDLAQPILGARLSLSADLGRKSYRSFALSLDGRRDLSLTVGATAVFEGLSAYGFAPTLSIRQTRNWSNVARFRRQGLSVQMGLQSVF